MEKTYTKGTMYSDQQMSLIKNTFTDKDLLQAIRKAMYGVDLLDKDLKALNAVNADVLTVIKRALKPTIDLELPLGKMVDLMMTVDFKEKSLEEMERNVEIRQSLLALLDRGIARIVNKTATGTNDIVDFHGGDVGKAYIIRLSARNGLIAHVDLMLNSLFLIATTPEETPEESKKKAVKNSSK